MSERFAGVTFIADRETSWYRSRISSKKQEEKFLFVSSLCFHIDTSACPAAAACPVMVSLWQHCLHLIERKTTSTPEGGGGSRGLFVTVATHVEEIPYNNPV